MPRFCLSRFFFVILVASLCAHVSLAGEKKSPPNIVVFLADDLGWGDLGCYGHSRIKTPNLDKFATQGMRFTQCYSGGAVCSPSRSALLTGRTPYRNGVFTWIPENSQVHLRNSEITIATLLKQLGYATCHVGKWHLNGHFNSPKQPQPNDHGFDWWLATQNNAAPSHKNPNNFARNGKAVGQMQGFSSLLIAEEAIRWLKKERDDKKPFYLQVWFHEPHLPIESDPEFMNLYPDLVKDDPDMAQHHGNVSQLDHAFGMVVRALQEMGLDENTLVIFTSDNGPEGNGTTGRTRGSTGGLRGRKRAVYEGGIRVPGLVRWPGHIKAGSVSDEPIIGSDVFTTICAINKIDLPSRAIDGANMLPAFSGGKIERKTPMYWRCNIAPGPLQVAMRQGDYTILADPAMTKFEMYNLKSDPQQKTDLAATEKDRFEQMRTTLVRLNAEIEKEGPDWWKNYQQGKKKDKK